MSYLCWKCKSEINPSDAASRTASCPSCDADIHVCKNCKYYDTGAHYDCHETNADLVSDKERANFCDYFTLNPNCASKSNEKSKSDNARDAFNSLFSN